MDGWWKLRQAVANLSIGMLNVFGPNIATVNDCVPNPQLQLLIRISRPKALIGSANENLLPLLSMNRKVHWSGRNHCARQAIWSASGFLTGREV